MCSDENRGLDCSETGTKSTTTERGQDLQDVGNNVQDAFTSWAFKLNSSLVILPAQFSRRNFPTGSKGKICEDTKGMKEKLMDQAEEKYRASSEWVEPTSVASRRQFTRNLCILVPQVTQL